MIKINVSIPTDRLAVASHDFANSGIVMLPSLVAFLEGGGGAPLP